MRADATVARRASVDVDEPSSAACSRDANADSASSVWSIWARLQDRLSKSRIYAAANIPEYWIVNLRESVVEVMRDPDPATALYRDTRICTADDALELAALPGARIAVAELLPKRS